VVEFLELSGLPRGIALIEGKLPSRREWKRIFDEDLCVNVLQMPRGAGDLGRLRPYAGRIRHLMVNSASCRDLSDIVLMSELRSLAIGGLVDVGADLSTLRNLEWFGAPIDAFDGVLNHPNLMVMRTTWNTARRLEITAPLVDLQLDESRALTDLPAISHPERLRRLAIDGPARFSLGGAHLLMGLEQIEISNCAALTDVGEISRLPLLKSLTLDNCPDIEGFWELSRLEGVHVRVGRRNPFNAGFRDEVRARPSSTWVFPPEKRYLPES
jgi:hypothetical protein